MRVVQIQILRAVGQPLLAGSASNYVRPTIRRKRLRSMLLQLEWGAEQFWEGMTMKELQDIVPDMGEHLTSFGDEMLATRAADMFGVCPKVGALLLPMAACFWTKKRGSGKHQRSRPHVHNATSGNGQSARGVQI